MNNKKILLDITHDMETKKEALGEDYTWAFILEYGIRMSLHNRPITSHTGMAGKHKNKE